MTAMQVVRRNLRSDGPEDGAAPVAATPPGLGVAPVSILMWTSQLLVGSMLFPDTVRWQPRPTVYEESVRLPSSRSCRPSEILSITIPARAAVAGCLKLCFHQQQLQKFGQ